MKTQESLDASEWFGFARKIAAKYASPGIDTDDLEQEACLAVLEGLPQFNAELGVSLKVFLGRRIQDKLRPIYRKTLNIVQLEQYWVVLHESGDSTENVRAETKERAEAVLKSNPTTYTGMKYVKVHAPIGPSLDAEDDDGVALHECVGAGPEQELGMLAAEMTAAVSTKLGRKGAELAEIFRLRSEGQTFEQIGASLGKDPNAVRMALSRAQKRLSRNKAA